MGREEKSARQREVQTIEKTKERTENGDKKRTDEDVRRETFAFSRQLEVRRVDRAHCSV